MKSCEEFSGKVFHEMVDTPLEEIIKMFEPKILKIFLIDKIAQKKYMEYIEKEQAQKSKVTPKNYKDEIVQNAIKEYYENTNLTVREQRKKYHIGSGTWQKGVRYYVTRFSRIKK